MENVAYVGYTTGSFDILIEAHLPDNEGLYKFLNEDLEDIEGIAYTETWHILRTEKTTSSGRARASAGSRSPRRGRRTGSDEDRVHRAGVHRLPRGGQPHPAGGRLPGRSEEYLATMPRASKDEVDERK
jgi:hypothetical protein